jgi:hypothetical protein
MTSRNAPPQFSEIVRKVQSKHRRIVEAIIGYEGLAEGNHGVFKLISASYGSLTSPDQDRRRRARSRIRANITQRAETAGLSQITLLTDAEIATVVHALHGRFSDVIAYATRLVNCMERPAPNQVESETEIILGELNTILEAEF